MIRFEEDKFTSILGYNNSHGVPNISKQKDQNFELKYYEEEEEDEEEVGPKPLIFLQLWTLMLEPSSSTTPISVEESSLLKT